MFVVFRVDRPIVLGLLLAATLFGRSEFVKAQEPTFICGPKNTTHRLASRNNFGWLENFSIGNFGTPNTFTPGTASGDRQITEALSLAKAYYQGYGFEPPILRCYQSGPNAASYSFYYGGSSANLGGYTAPWNTLVPDIDKAKIEIDPVIRTTFAEMGPGRTGVMKVDHLMTPGHELFHGIQASYKLFKLIPADWVDEGLADAFGYLFLRDYAATIPNSRIDKTINNMPRREIRYINYPLHLPKNLSSDPTLNGDEKLDAESQALDQAYGTSVFWEFLIDNKVFNIRGSNIKLDNINESETISVKIILDYFNIKDKYYDMYKGGFNPGKEVFAILQLDEILVEKFNEALSRSNRLDYNGGGLAVVYPKFAAWLLSQANPAKGTPDLAMVDSVSHAQLFDTQPSCTEIEVPSRWSGTNAKTVKIKVLGSVCLKVKPASAGTPRDFHVFVRASDGLGEPERLYAGWDGNVQEPEHRLSISLGRSWLVKPDIMSLVPQTGEIYVSLSNVGLDLEKDTVGQSSGEAGGDPVPPKQEYEFKIYVQPFTSGKKSPLKR